MIKKPLPSREFLLACFDYDPETGALTWRWREDVDGRTNTRMAGTPAGSSATTQGRYIRVKLCQEHFAAHRIIFKMMTGCDPDSVDHDDRDGLNNKWSNLCDADQAQNCCNRRTPERAFPRGVGPLRGRYRADIQFRGKPQYLGSYETVEEAHEVYKDAARRLHGKFNKSAA